MVHYAIDRAMTKLEMEVSSEGISAIKDAPFKVQGPPHGNFKSEPK
jgi:hypothetical protein